MAFSGQILIDSVDYYAQLTGELSVRIDEGAARLARFTLDPMPGAIDPYLWIGKPVVINFIDGSTDLLFTGLVHTVDYDIDAGTTEFVCTDALQEVFETVTRPAADKLITAGLWSDKIFRSTKDNWDYAQQKMSTTPASLDKSPAGALRITPWAAKSTPDLTYTAATIDSGTLKIDQLAERRSIVNSVKIKYSSVFQALRQREQAISWTAEYPSPGNWFQYLEHTFDLPERQAIEAALRDWTLKTIEYVDLPDSGIYSYLGEDHVWILSDYSRNQCQGFNAVVAIRWRQDIAIEYSITVANAASVAQHGLLEVEQSYNISHKTKGRDDDFLKFDAYKAPEGAHVVDLVGSDEWLSSTQGDDSLPQLVALSIAKTRILASHRQNRISFECALNADIDVDLTVAIDHSKLTAKGKVTAVEHRIDVLEGFAITKCTIAVTLPQVSGQTDDTISRALTPYITSAPSLVPPESPPSWPTLLTHIGNDDGVDPDDPTWNGWISNYDFWSGLGDPPPVYDPIRFAIESPAVDDTDFNAWLNATWELQTKVVKIGAADYQRVLFSGQTVAAGDSVQLYNGDTEVGAPVIVTNGHLEAGYIDIEATEMQDEHSITYLVTDSFNVAIPVDVLTLSK